MRLIFWYAEKGHEKALGPAIAAGAAQHGDEVEMRSLADYHGPDRDGGIICGVVKREVLRDHLKAGRLLLYLDKGYGRTRLPWQGMNLPEWWRVVVNDTHPTAYLMRRPRPADRWRMMRAPLEPRRCGKAVVIAGSSAKYHQTHDLPHPTRWAADLIRAIRALTPRPIIYRPKPSWHDAEAVSGAIFDFGMKTSFRATIEDAWCVVTHGSIASVEAITGGVPCIILGHAVARPISSTSLDDLPGPRWCDDAERQQWASNLAYCHFRVAEFADGTAWRIIREQIGDTVGTL